MGFVVRRPLGFARGCEPEERDPPGVSVGHRAPELGFRSFEQFIVHLIGREAPGRPHIHLGTHESVGPERFMKGPTLVDRGDKPSTVPAPETPRRGVLSEYRVRNRRLQLPHDGMAFLPRAHRNPRPRAAAIVDE